MRFILLADALPFLAVCVCWLFGLASVRRFLGLLMLWVVMCEAVGLWAIFHFDDPRGLVIIAIAVFAALLGPLLLMPFSVRVVPAEQPPVVVAAQVYDSLNPGQKEVVHKIARGAVKIGLQALGQHLKGKGYVSSGDAIRRTAHLV
jgi:hypothetical protein